MLTALKQEDFDKYIDWAYNLALDITRSSYPTYTDGIKTKEDFIKTSLKAFSSEYGKILLYTEENTVLGWLHYYFIPEDKYIGLHSFNTEKHTKNALKEFEAYCRKNFRDYTLYMGFDSKNFDAISYFKENGYNLLETSFPTVFHFAKYSPLKCNDRVVKITKENYGLFRNLHDQVKDMYWNSERILNSLSKRILNSLSKWNIYYYENKDGKGAIYFTGDIPEIFGIDFDNGKFDKSIYLKLITKCLNVCHSLKAEHLYYFPERYELEILKKMGFISLGVYNCYTLCLT